MIVGTLSSGQDITQRKQAEEAAQRYHRDMAHVMRLSTMGEMATGMAHELNQPLTAIVSYCGTALSLLNALPSSSQQLGEIMVRTAKQAHRASDIIRHLREHVRKEDQGDEFFELDHAIQDIITFIKREVQQRGAEIESRLGGQERKVKGRKIQIEQVLINLVLNSLEAFDHGEIAEGRIVIQTRLLPKGLIEAIVTDNGPGIDVTMTDNIFDQFQANKEHGMVFGLSLSRSIIVALGGNLWADKNHRTGALFCFELPVSE